MAATPMMLLVVGDLDFQDQLIDELAATNCPPTVTTHSEVSDSISQALCLYSRCCGFGS
jgi:hypothetical protein